MMRLDLALKFLGFEWFGGLGDLGLHEIDEVA